uniref:Protein kinase domain containing protein, expressed n=1 Tax=Oryza sativa subsp. japonica TaxID=39947 RepID=Q2R4L1_ORYSJ|nr:Protein kinase domain containing protein, expressed [Oryza sativa Japonica Group]
MDRLLLAPSAVALLVVASAWVPAAADPQITLLNLGCSQYNATPAAAFLAALNATFAVLRANLSSAGGGGGFATAAEPRAAAPAFAMAQCRPYVAGAGSCAACFDAAASRLRARCGAANGGRAILDGCVVRYESAAFFDGPATLPGNTQVCNGTAVADGSFAGAARGLVGDLAAAAPRAPGLAAAAARGGVYAAAQCVETVGEGGCAQCLPVPARNIDGCPPDSDGRAVDAGCFMRYSDKPFFPANATIDLAPYLRSPGKSNHKGAIIGGILGGVAFLLLGLLALFWTRQSKKPLKPRRGDILGATELQGPTSFYYKDLKVATNNFSEQSKLGEGGFGDVFKASLKNGKTVAVKRLTVMETSRAKADFESEVKLISNVHHRNLVRLLGCASKGSECLLVYEYMANGSLDKFLFGEKSVALNWKQRFNIIIGMARGLAYLHEEFHVRIIHRDIKSSNVLLDDEFQPKIADFGLARLIPDDHSHLSTNFAGTLGYTAPEYAIHGQLSEKVDTYGFGVVTLEIIGGRKLNDARLEPDSQYLLEWAWKLYEDNNLIELVDRSLDPEEYNHEEVKRTMEIALLCTQSAVTSRPMMSEVVVLLLTRNALEFQPTRPTFIDATRRVPGETSTSSSSSASKATVSISQLSAR